MGVNSPELLAMNCFAILYLESSCYERYAVVLL